MISGFARRLYSSWKSSRLQQEIFQQSQLAEAVLQPMFPQCITLPEPFGRGLPERVVEIFLARLLYRPGMKTLDVGHANSMKCHLEMIRSLAEPRQISGIDIAQPSFPVGRYYQDSVRADISESGFPDETFDLIWCISALEHFGMDNSGYTDCFTLDGGLAARALVEMFRIIKPQGKILLTVPYGKYEDHGWLINYDATHWQALLGTLGGKAMIHEWYFKHTFRGGWTVSDAKELQYTGYYDQANHGSAGLAVACIVK